LGRPGTTSGGGAAAAAAAMQMHMPHAALGMWPAAGLAPGMGYFSPAAAAVTAGGWPPGMGAGTVGGDGSGSAQHLLLPPRRFKHCASHVYIAHFIDHQQQQQRYAYFQQQFGGAFAPGVPSEAAAYAAAADARAACASAREASEFAAQQARSRLPAVPPVAPFGFPGLMAGVDRGGAGPLAASAAAQAQAQAQMQYAQVGFGRATAHLPRIFSPPPYRLD
jgi:hypothetical protein